jgi:hypothetical protein
MKPALVQTLPPEKKGYQNMCIIYRRTGESAEDNILK